MWKTLLPSPVGTLYASASDVALCELLFDKSKNSSLSGTAKLVEAGSHPILAKLQQQLSEYFAGKRQEFDLPLEPVGSEFQLAVWNALRTIPFGETRSYSEQANMIGKPSAVRAVGAANGKNPISIVIPCHRVIGKNGKLIGFGGGIPVKQFLLDHELRLKPNRPIFTRVPKFLETGRLKRRGAWGAVACVSKVS